MHQIGLKTIIWCNFIFHTCYWYIIYHQKVMQLVNTSRKITLLTFLNSGVSAKNISGNKSNNRRVSRLYSCQSAWAFPSDSRLNLRWPPRRLSLPPTKPDFVFCFCFLFCHFTVYLSVCRLGRCGGGGKATAQQEGHQQQVCLMQTDLESSSPTMSTKGS